MKVSFHGADRGVTGSCHMLEAGGLRILVDCGMFQGRRDIARENDQPFGFAPDEIDCLLLTHAHLDHCGRVPLLATRGFRGEIIATAATRELARLVLLDSAHIHEEEAKRAARKASPSDVASTEPLYTVADAMGSFSRFGRTAAYDAPIALNDTVTVTFVDAGHILGSASVVIDVGGRTAPRRIVFSGDIGSPGHPIVRNPTPPPRADYVVMETTYGDRVHRSLQDSVEELFEAVRATFARGGNAIVPTFALERSQEVLYFLREGVAQGRLPRNAQVFLDSPMAISATEIMRRHPECFDDEARRALELGDPFAPPGLHFSRESADSMALNRITGGAVIMAGSGMCSGGRIRHHLRHNLSREASSVIFVGYAAEGTLAREIIDGARVVDVLGEPTRVRARVHTINGFSAHADQTELLAWHAACGDPAMTFLVHGDAARGMRGMAEQLAQRGHATTCPALQQSVPLD
jgi:metallo-beta-lactamase family protein